MASPRVGSLPPKMSFAKVHAHHQPTEPTLTPPQVAAMHVPNPPKPTNNIPEDKKSQSKESINRRSTVISPKPQATSPHPETTPQPAKAEVAVKGPETNGDSIAIQGLSLVSHISPTASGVKGAASADSNDDDQSHLSNSSDKQQSFETKSMASVTTFAMDEKESIRPDDSASVRAVDDEDLASTLSRNSTFQQESSVIMPTLRGGAGILGPPVALAPRRYPTLTNPPRFGDLEPPPIPQSEVNQTPPSSVIPEHQEEPSIRVPPPVSPDEKLLDALASPKDRLSILQLEERLLAFMTQANVDFIDLPPQNSYARLLAHKLADYYSLLHHINEDGTSIRIFRTAASNLPTPLTVLAQSIPVGSAQSLPNAVKIMRRAGIRPRQLSTTNSTAPSSSGVPSKTTSEAGHSEEGVISPTEASTPSRNKSNMTREEREAQYKAARERIFGDFQELSISENVSTGENSASMSRSSSSSGKKKARRQKTPKDDSFDSRSAFVPGYGGVHVQPIQPAYQPQSQMNQMYQNQYEGSATAYAPQMDYGTTPTQPYGGFDQSMSMTSPAAFGPMSPQNFNMLESWQNMQQQPGNGYFNYPQPQSGYQQNIPQMMQQMNNQFIQQPPNMQQQGGWTNSQYPNPYQPQTSPAQPPPNWTTFQPQPYGQMPNQFPIAQPMSPQGQIPGNYNRSLFNPQTRSFIPGTSGTRPKNGRKKNQSIPLNQPQSRNSSGTKSYMSSTSSGATMIPSRGPPQDFQRSSSSSSSLQPSEESLQRKYGAPANLPKKPPPTQTTQFDVGSISNVKPPGGGAPLNGNVGGSGNVRGAEAEESVTS